MPFLFAYGSLQKEDVQLSTFGRLLPGEPARLSGFELVSIAIEDPEIIAATGMTHYANALPNDAPGVHIDGMVFEVTHADLESADHFERPAGYQRMLVKVASGRHAWIYRGPSR